MLPTDFTDFTDFFVAAAGATGALVGLLFVAVSVSPERLHSKETGVYAEIHAATALLCFTDVLAVSLFALVPRDDPGFPATVFGVIGLAFAGSAIRSVLSRARDKRRALPIAAGLSALFGFQTAYGVITIATGQRSWAVSSLCTVLIVALLAGIARAWQLVGLRDTGLITSLGILVRGEKPDTDKPDTDEPPTDR
jgi:xanthine/uracil/vitamin C permease (AzgA family)